MIKIIDLNTLETKRIHPASTRVMRRAMSWRKSARAWNIVVGWSELLKASWRMEKGAVYGNG